MKKKKKKFRVTIKNNLIQQKSNAIKKKGKFSFAFIDEQVSLV